MGTASTGSRQTSWYVNASWKCKLKDLERSYSLLLFLQQRSRLRPVGSSRPSQSRCSSEIASNHRERSHSCTSIAPQTIHLDRSSGAGIGSEKSTDEGTTFKLRRFREAKRGGQKHATMELDLPLSRSISSSRILITSGSCEGSQFIQALFEDEEELVPLSKGTS